MLTASIALNCYEKAIYFSCETFTKESSSGLEIFTSEGRGYQNRGYSILSALICSKKEGIRE